MGVIFTGQAEKERVAKNQAARGSWELITTTSIVEALHFARDHGWEQKKVQVRATAISEDLFEYSVEPWEKDCTCPDILRFSDYFDPAQDEIED